MSDGSEVEVENTSGYAILPKDVTDEIGSVKLFNKWSYEDVEIRDISLTYGTLNPLNIKLVEENTGRHREAGYRIWSWIFG
jgi:hypothetical protein